MSSMKGKTVIVSGSSRGIGRAVAERFGALGAQVVLSGTSDSVHATCEALRAAGMSATAVVADISTPEGAQRLVDTAVETYGTVDILVNNAGITRDKLIIRMDEEDWDAVLDTNLKGAFLLTKAAAKVMMKKRTGRIVNITSVVGVSGNAGQANYAASKAGLIGFTKSIARELASRSITCNVVAPGFIETDMTAVLPTEVTDGFKAQTPAGRMGSVADIAHAVRFLCSDGAGYISGAVIPVDGGLGMGH